MPYLTDEQSRARAHRFWEEAGWPQGRAGEFLLRAERARTEAVVTIFAKAEASPNGSVRGFRHTMLEDTDISATRHARAAVGGLIGGLAGSGAVYVSGGAEQGPPGRRPCCRHRARRR